MCGRFANDAPRWRYPGPSQAVGLTGDLTFAPSGRYRSSVPADTPEAPAFRGLHMPLPGQVRMTGMTRTANGELTVDGWEVRIELWPMWLRLAEESAASSSAARFTNPGPDDRKRFDADLVDELRHAMTAISAAAFTLEAFTASLLDTEPAVRPPEPRKDQRTPQHKKVAEAWGRAFQLSSADLCAARTDLKQIFHLRNQAVHVKSEFVTPGMNDYFQVALHPLFLWFSHGNATATVQRTRNLLTQAIRTPRERHESIVRWASAQLPLLQP